MEAGTVVPCVTYKIGDFYDKGTFRIFNCPKALQNYKISPLISYAFLIF